jgi:energy-coupling factor transporter ATP-binding protein EcfA2
LSEQTNQRVVTLSGGQKHVATHNISDFKKVITREIRLEDGKIAYDTKSNGNWKQIKN